MKIKNKIKINLKESESKTAPKSRENYIEKKNKSKVKTK